MLSEKLLAELNDQIKYELLSANYYLAMAAWCTDEDLDGFSHFFLIQAEEERFHAMKFFNFIKDLGGRVIIQGYPDPNNSFSSITDVFQAGLEHEQFVTKRIHGLLDLAKQENHHPTISFLQWFVNEQVEEEASFTGIVNKLRKLEGNMAGIFMLDAEMAKRTFTPPAE
jgi:ferritin